MTAESLAPPGCRSSAVSSGEAALQTGGMPNWRQMPRNTGPVSGGGVFPNGVIAALTLEHAAVPAQVAIRVSELHAVSSIFSLTARAEAVVRERSRRYARDNWKASCKLARASSIVSPRVCTAGISSTQQT